MAVLNMESCNRTGLDLLVLTKGEKLFVFNCDNEQLDSVGSAAFSSDITSHGCCGSKIAITCGEKVIIMNMAIEEGLVEEHSWGIDGDGTSVTWSDKTSITVVTKNSVVGFSSFSSTPVEDFRVEAGSQEISGAVRNVNRLFVLSSTGDVYATDISSFPASLQEISRIEEGVTNILQCELENLIIFKNGQLLRRERNQDEFSKVIADLASVNLAATQKIWCNSFKG